MVFSASLPASAMVSPDCKNENDDENAAVSFREMTRERETKDTKLEMRFPNAQRARTTTTLTITRRAKDVPNSTRR